MNELIKNSLALKTVREYLIGKGETFTQEELEKFTDLYLDRYIKNIQNGMQPTGARELALDSL